MRRALTLVALASVLALLGQFVPPLAGIGHACLCGDYPPTAQALQDADAVFVGRVSTLDEMPVEVPHYDIRTRQTNMTLVDVPRARFQIIQTWKGVSGQDVDVFTGRGGGDCGYPFELRQVYLIYARSYEGG